MSNAKQFSSSSTKTSTLLQWKLGITRFLGPEKFCLLYPDILLYSGNLVIKEFGYNVTPLITRSFLLGPQHLYFVVCFTLI